jgi:hypothetical protein
MPNPSVATQPVFLLFIAFTCLLTLGYFWGRRENRRIAFSALEALVEVVRPDDQTFTNIGGAIGYHANLLIRKKGPVRQVDATITLLPRYAWLYLPLSKVIRKYDRLFITVHLRHKPFAEGHLIEESYAAFGGPKIQNARRLAQEKVKWGGEDFCLFYETVPMRDKLQAYLSSHPDPGGIRHVALVPDQKRGFIFMIPRKGKVGTFLAPAYGWLTSLATPEHT